MIPPSTGENRMRLLPCVVTAAIVAAALTVTGCKESDPVATGTVDVSRTPTMMTRDVETLISDSGVTRFRITTPVWYVYDEADEPFWNFPEGLHLEKFDNFFRREATVTADSAVYFKNKQVWRLDGNVNITNVMNEKFLTEQLFWDQRQHKLYSDSFIHIERPDKVLEGYGFDSNEQLTRYTIRRVSGIFPAGAFRPGEKSDAQPRQEPPATDADTSAPDGQPAQQAEPQSAPQSRPRPGSRPLPPAAAPEQTVNQTVKTES